MPRWEPDARLRLVAAAIELFTERGYEETTVAEVAARAGLTKSTFFRYFPDKKDVLAAGQEAITRLLVMGIASAAQDASPLEAVAAGVVRTAEAMTEVTKELGPRINALIASNPELQARAQLKHAALVRSVAEALAARSVSEPVAKLAAELGMLAFADAHAAWITAGNREGFAELARIAIDRLRETMSQIT
ncbi:AcrR family transcriptional regulator [Psychromicrobium silvestre]|uniref:AcrR family transcriptional regulator n=1 Tax=Psychromicrobium silvestre TaxID=1645614 RepID=A0A7Y9S5C3_9MICC|nr:TetR family transcriptional regulator [Psychromicrobium silvestre]NYE94430.1 AcrR family transcriptional regulator [Psychromicrobium silvestre]